VATEGAEAQNQAFFFASFCFLWPPIYQESAWSIVELETFWFSRGSFGGRIAAAPGSAKLT